LDPASAVIKPDLEQSLPSLGYAKDRRPRAPPCPLYRLYGVCLS
jgi:hypothetical protein